MTAYVTSQIGHVKQAVSSVQLDVAHLDGRVNVVDIGIGGTVLEFASVKRSLSRIETEVLALQANGSTLTSQSNLGAQASLAPPPPPPLTCGQHYVQYCSMGALGAGCKSFHTNISNVYYNCIPGPSAYCVPNTAQACTKLSFDAKCDGKVPIGPMFDEALDIMYKANELPLLPEAESKAFHTAMVPCLSDMNVRYELNLNEAAGLFLQMSSATAYGFKPSTCGPPLSGTADPLRCQKTYDYMENTPATVVTDSGTRLIAERCDAASNLAYLSGAVLLHKKFTAPGNAGFTSLEPDTVQAAMKILVNQAWGSATFHAGGSVTGPFNHSEASLAEVPEERLWKPNTTDVFGYHNLSYTAAFPPDGALGAVGFTALSGRLFDTVPTSISALIAWQATALPLLEEGLIDQDLYTLGFANATNLVHLMDTLYTSPISDSLSILQEVQSNVAGYRQIFPAVVASGIALLGDNTVTRALLQELNKLLNPETPEVYDDIILPILRVQDKLSAARRVPPNVAACVVAQGIPILALFMWAFMWQEETFKLWAVTNSNLANMLGGLLEGVIGRLGVSFFDLPRHDTLVDELIGMNSSMYPAISWCRLAFGKERAAHAKWHSASAIGLPALLLWADRIKDAQSKGANAECLPETGLWADMTDLLVLMLKIAA